MKQIFLIMVLCIAINVGAQPRYYKAQMHCHTTNSDGQYAPLELINKYKNEGYEILMITDHNFITNAAQYYIPGVLCIRSEEITFDRHMNGFFLNNVIVPTSNFSCQDAIDAVKSQGGLIQLNHYCAGLFTPDAWEVSANEILTFNNGPDILEIHNVAQEALQTHDDRTIWDSLLTAGKIVWGGADDDFHPAVLESIEFNNAWNMILLDTLTPNNVYQALKNGDFYASTGVEIYEYNVTDMGNYKIIEIDSDASKIQFWGPGHTLIYEVNGGYAQYILQDYACIRAELIIDGVLSHQYAWTQPVILDTTTNIINKLPLIADISIYPNPATTEIFLDLFTNKSTYADISIINQLGQKQLDIFNDKLNIYQNNIHADVSSLDEGQYIIIIETQDSYNGIPLQIIK